MEADKYGGREQSYLKHVLLEAYLQSFAYKVGAWAKTITYIDGFAGPWKHQDEEFADTSFATAVRVLSEVRNTSRQGFRIRCLFVEKDKQAFEELERYSREQAADYLHIRTIHGGFEDNLSEIEAFSKSGGTENFTFILLDPKGWTGLSLFRLSGLLSLRNTEVLVNLMLEFVRRFPDEGLARLVGPEHAKVDLTGLEGLDRDAQIVASYRNGLESYGSFKFVTSAFIPHPNRDRVYFHLVYGTNHEKGIQAFKEAESKAVHAASELRSSLRRREESNDQLPWGDVDERDELLMQMEGRSVLFLEGLLKTIQPGESQSYDFLWKQAMAVPMVTSSRLHQAIRNDPALCWEGLKPKERVGKLRANHRVGRVNAKGCV